MKKRLLALLLAGLLTASMASCVSSAGGRNDQTGGTEGTQTRQPVATNPPAPTVTWTEVNETVYVTADTVTLIGVDDAANKLAVTKMTSMTRTAIGSNETSIVLVDGVKYYVSSASITNQDLFGNGFVACDPTIMYITADGVAVREYASKNSKRIGELLKLNDTVTVIARGDAWVKIQYDADHQYFVNAEYVSASLVTDVNNIANYPAFDAVEPFTLYVTASMLNLRLCPNDDERVTVVTTLNYGAAVTVEAQAEVNGTTWYKVKYTARGGEGQGDLIYFGYLSKSQFVSTVNPTPSLEEMVAAYPAFSKLPEAQTMYVSTEVGSLNVRKTPDFSDNLTDFSLKTKAPVKVVATGTMTDTLWGMIEVEGKYYFVSYKFLTADPDGKPMPLTLEQILAIYPTFAALDDPKTATAKGVTNCNPKPQEHEAEDIDTKLAAGETVTVVAEGVYGGKTWYVFQKNGVYFFAGAEMFNLGTSEG